MSIAIIFLKAYAKNEQVDLTPDDKKRLSVIVNAIKQSLKGNYQEGKKEL